MEWVSLINVKLDCLGLRSVSVVDDACKAIGIKETEIDLTNPEMYQPLQEIKSPHGLFQIEADTAFNALKRIKPKNLEELSGVLAIARPGAMSFLDEYASFTNTGTANSIHPFFDDIFGVTGGQCLYQEQLIAAIRKIGFTAEEGETVRRIVGKKKPEEMKLWHKKITDKVLENGLDPAISEIVWKIAENSANYSFNKCLSLDTIVETEHGDELISEIIIGDKVKAYDIDNNKDHFVEVLNIHSNQVELFEVELEDGRVITCSLDHKLLCEDGKMRPVKEILILNCGVVCNN
jgi:DNA polymerase-3 subunit alpha